MKTHSILIEDMRTGQMQVMEFYTHQAALDAIVAICDEQDKTVHGPFVLGAAEADQELEDETWTLNSQGQVVAKKGNQIGGDPDHPMVYLDLFDNDPGKLPSQNPPGCRPRPLEELAWLREEAEAFARRS